MSNELIIANNQQLAANFLPVFTTETAKQRYQAFKDFVKGVLKEGIDFGKNPGSDRDTLLKPGAEKLCTFFGLTPRYILEVVIEDWRGEKYEQPLFYYRFKCQLFRGDFQMGEGIGSCSSWEAKYRYRWVDENTVNRMGLDKAALSTRGGAMSEFEFAVNKSETSGQYGKPAEYWAKWKQAIADGKARKIQKTKKDGTTSPAWEMDMTMYRVPNSEFADIINTVQKIAQKRAYVAATLSCTNASDYFTQDLEDYIINVDEGEFLPKREEEEGQPRKPASLRPAPAVIDVQAERPVPAAAVKPTPAPTPAPTAAFEGGKSKGVPEGLQTLWRQMFKPEGRLQVFDMFKANLIESLGEEEGSRAFYAVLNRHNAKEPRDFTKSLSDARQAAKDLYEIVEPLLEKKAS